VTLLGNRGLFRARVQHTDRDAAEGDDPQHHRGRCSAPVGRGPQVFADTVALCYGTPERVAADRSFRTGGPLLAGSTRHGRERPEG
jgi:hypothetical protein